MKKKVVTIEVKTDLNNNDLKNVYKESWNANVVVVQVQVNLIKPEKK